MGLLRMPERRSLLNGSLEIAILKFSFMVYFFSDC